MKISNKTKIKLLKWIISMGVLLLGVWVLLSLIGCSYFERYPYVADNWGEEIIEEIIEVKTGWSLDLSPGSPEDGDR